jgi:hypothetical protein
MLAKKGHYNYPVTLLDIKSCYPKAMHDLDYSIEYPIVYNKSMNFDDYKCYYLRVKITYFEFNEFHLYFNEKSLKKSNYIQYFNHIELKYLVQDCKLHMRYLQVIYLKNLKDLVMISSINTLN